MNNEQRIEAIKEHRTAIRQLGDQIRRIQNDIVQLKQGFDTKFKVGEIWETPKGRFQIVSIQVEDSGRLSWGTKVRKIRKDGMPSESLHYFFGQEEAVKIADSL